MLRFVFVGEKRSQTAIKRGWTWESGRLAAKTLQEALLALGLRYGEHYTCRNLWDDAGEVCADTMRELARFVGHGAHLVSLGHKVDRLLCQYAIPALRIIHPAARGAIRQRAVYQAHVQTVLSPYLEDV